MVSGVAMKLTAPRKASLRRCVGGCRANRGEALGDSIAVDCAEFGRDVVEGDGRARGRALLQTSAGFLLHPSSS